MDELRQFLSEKYSANLDYVDAYLEYWNATNSSIKSIQDFSRISDHEKMWLDFALSANWRGSVIVDFLSVDNIPKNGSRHLDIGSGFGGVIYNFIKRGYESVGVELDPVRVDLANSNIRSLDCPISKVIKADILKDEKILRIGKFDWITCIDVIEHVADVVDLSKAISGLLKPNGEVFLEIPNKDSIDFIYSDGHFGLKGITQLQRWAAIQYQQLKFKFEYDVGDYYPLDYYKTIFNKVGLHLEAHKSPLEVECDIEELKFKIREFANLEIREWIDFDFRGNESLLETLFGALRAYQNNSKNDLEKLERHEIFKEDLIMKYGYRFWGLKGKVKNNV